MSQTSLLFQSTTARCASPFGSGVASFGIGDQVEPLSMTELGVLAVPDPVLVRRERVEPDLHRRRGRINLVNGDCPLLAVY